MVTIFVFLLHHNQNHNQIRENCHQSGKLVTGIVQLRQIVVAGLPCVTLIYDIIDEARLLSCYHGKITSTNECYR